VAVFAGFPDNFPIEPPGQEDCVTLGVRLDAGKSRHEVFAATSNDSKRATTALSYHALSHTPGKDLNAASAKLEQLDLRLVI
jgi:hypothetical protein